MREQQAIELSAGRIEYVDTGGHGPPVVLLHGLLMDWTLWTDVIAELSLDHRCVAPTLPLGAHRHPMQPDADLSLGGVARLVLEFLERLQLDRVTLVGNDTGGALVQLLASGASDRVAAIGLVSCDAFDNFPPGLTGRAVVLSGKLPPALFGAFMQPMRLKPIRRLPIAFGWLTKRGDKATRRWLDAILTTPEVRRDTVRVLRGIAADPRLLDRAAGSLPGFERPALVAWASEDRVMPPDHGRRLTQLLPDARWVEITDSYTLIPLDQPAKLANHLRQLTARAPRPAAALASHPVPGNHEQPAERMP
jgi:pimeloyl-ACP methyl ester carboxylesterase